MASPTLLPDPTCLHLNLLEASDTAITAIVTTTSPEAECPLCHGRTARIHSRYVRQVADLPWMGCAVRLELHVRRFFCSNQQCARQIFTERLPRVVAPYARRTTRLTDLFTLIGFALGGEAGKQLVEGMGLQASPDTLLRLIRRAPEAALSTPRVLGVDDFSFRRGRIFGTILVDLEKRIPVDLLPVKRDFAKSLLTAKMYREIKEQGYTGSSTNVGRFLAPLRASKGTPRSFKAVEPQPETMINPEEVKKKRPPTALQVARWMTFTKEQRLGWQNDFLTRLCQADPLIAQTFDLMQEFATMLRERKGERLDAWIAQVEAQEVAELKSFARGLQKDYDAVKAGLTLEWSNGQVEGQVHRLKLLKRQMYGRGGFEILRKRVLQRA